MTSRGNSHAKFSPRGIVTRTLISRPVANVIHNRTMRGRPLLSHGVPVEMRHPSVPAATQAAVFWGLYERTDIGLIRDWADPSCDAVNLGAGYGVTTTHLLAKLRPDRRVLAVEANPKTFPALKTALIGDRRAVPVHAAIDYEAEGDTVPFYPNPLALRSATRADGETPAVPVARATLSGLLDQYQMNTLYTLVMDIEGAEAGILWDDADALTTCQKIIAELHTRTYRGPTVYRGREVTADQMVERIRDLGFTLVEQRRQTYAFAK